jgi:hypothetical protein
MGSWCARDIRERWFRFPVKQKVGDQLGILQIILLQ